MTTDQWEANLDALRAGIDLKARIDELKRELEKKGPHTVIIDGVEFFKDIPREDD